jgi:small subunit ribosomal protein S3
MATERKFLAKALTDYSIKEYLEKELSRAGVSAVAVQQTPIATRITITVQRPGIVVGKRGSSITSLAQALESRFHIDNPQIEVVEVPIPSLDSKLMADRIGHQIELRDNAKQAVRFALREIMSAGAIGAEIRVAGKIVGKGGKAKAFTVRAGYLKKSGDLVKLVHEGKYTAYPKAGAVGITVKILPPGTNIPDKIDLRAMNQAPQELTAAEVEAANAAAQVAVADASVEPAVTEEPVLQAAAVEPTAEAVAEPKKKRARGPKKEKVQEPAKEEAADAEPAVEASTSQ